jgi:hypothetical protein
MWRAIHHDELEYGMGDLVREAEEVCSASGVDVEVLVLCTYAL